MPNPRLTYPPHLTHPTSPSPSPHHHLTLTSPLPCAYVQTQTWMHCAFTFMFACRCGTFHTPTHSHSLKLSPSTLSLHTGQWQCLAQVPSTHPQLVPPHVTMTMTWPHPHCVPAQTSNLHMGQQQWHLILVVTPPTSTLSCAVTNTLPLCQSFTWDDDDGALSSSSSLPSPTSSCRNNDNNGVSPSPQAYPHPPCPPLHTQWQQ